MLANISFIKCVDLVADRQKSVLLSWIISSQIGIGNLSSDWLELNIFIPRFWVYNYGGWQGRWLTQAVIFKPPKWVYLNQIYKGFLWNLTNKWKLFIMSTFLGGWHLLKWVKKWLTLKCLVLWYILAKIVVITWTE